MVMAPVRPLLIADREAGRFSVLLYTRGAIYTRQTYYRHEAPNQGANETKQPHTQNDQNKREVRRTTAYKRGPITWTKETTAPEARPTTSASQRHGKAEQPKPSPKRKTKPQPTPSPSPTRALDSIDWWASPRCK